MLPNLCLKNFFVTILMGKIQSKSYEQIQKQSKSKNNQNSKRKV